MIRIIKNFFIGLVLGRYYICFMPADSDGSRIYLWNRFAFWKDAILYFNSREQSYPYGIIRDDFTGKNVVTYRKVNQK